ncbi:hypothetical protein VB779_19005 [Haloarculaceae archaeon H-GB11]|nr:hypothetical protein [Haloarculaceae archaeon H-GB11]
MTDETDRDDAPRVTVVEVLRAVPLVAGVCGVLAAVVVGALALGGGLPPAIRTPMAVLTDGVGVVPILGVAAVAAGLYGLWRAATGSTSGDSLDPLVETPPERVSGDGGRPAADVAATFERETATADRGVPERGETRALLRRGAATAYAAAADCDDETARAAVADATWTDDRLAAAFLSTDGAATFPLRERLYAWFYPQAAHRRYVTHTVDVVATLYEEVTDAGSTTATVPDPVHERGGDAVTAAADGGVDE